MPEAEGAFPLCSRLPCPSPVRSGTVFAANAAGVVIHGKYIEGRNEIRAQRTVFRTGRGSRAAVREDIGIVQREGNAVQHQFQRRHPIADGFHDTCETAYPYRIPYAAGVDLVPELFVERRVACRRDVSRIEMEEQR